MKLRFFIVVGMLLLVRGVFAAANYANSAPAIGSQYGLVQNVQNYSSNPFWDPNGPYNQRIAPTVVYMQGADLDTDDCQRTVATLVAAYCAQFNNCVGLSLSDVRPSIMLQLSRLPGHNYATACAGFIDAEYSSYVSKYANAGSVNYAVPFPVGTVPTPAADTYEFKIENPYETRDPDWKIEKRAREQELRDLQSMNGAGGERLARADFPLTVSDLSFSERMANKAAGYEPYKDMSAYDKANLTEWEDYDSYRDRMMGRRTQAAAGGNRTSGGKGDAGKTPIPDERDTMPPVEYACISSVATDNTFLAELQNIFTKYGIDTKKATQESVDAILADMSVRPGLLTELAESVKSHCMTELHKIANGSNNLTVPVNIAGATFRVNLTVDELFEYMTIYTAIVVSDNRALAPGATIANSGGAKYWSKECSPHTVMWNLSDKAGVNKAGQAAFTQFGGSDNEYFLDFPKGDNQRAFTGMVMVDKTYSVQDDIVVFSNFKTGLDTTAAFAKALNGGPCAGTTNRLAVYYVMVPITLVNSLDQAAQMADITNGLVVLSGLGGFIASGFIHPYAGKIESVTVLSDPYIVR